MKHFQIIIFCLINSITIAQTVAKDERNIKPHFSNKGVKPIRSNLLNPEISEGSGLVAWNGSLWTHNDSGEAKLFSIDTLTGAVLNEYILPNVKNEDWEDLSQDNTNFYIGAFGNNTGNRNTLHILRINKMSLLNRKPLVDTITFTWPETTTKGKTSKINFDCEAMAVMNDSIYLFTKEWKNGKRTRLFSLPTVPGNYEAHYLTTLKIRLLITGASYHADTQKLVLCGYNLLCRPFIIVFSQSSNTFLFDEGKKIKIRLLFRQVEGISTFDGESYFAINENLRFLFLHTKQKLHKIKI